MQKLQQVKKIKAQTCSKTWDQKSISMTLKKSHSKNIISISPLSQTLFYTSSQDNTLRLWDLRLSSSVKLITCTDFNANNNNNKNQQLSNCQNNLKNSLYVGFSRHVYQFDIRNQLIFVEKVQKVSEDEHFDDISYLKYSEKLNQLAVADDEGDIRLYNADNLEEIGLMDQNHTNICNSIDFMFPQKSSSPLCFSGGFDCRLIQWNITQQTPIKQIDMNQIFKKYQIHASNTLPFIYHLHCYQSSVLISLQSGHIVCTSWNQLKKPKFIMQANLAKIIQTKIFQYKNLTSMISLNGDKSFSLFDYTKREGGCPMFLQKYSIPFEGSWIEGLGDDTVLVAGYAPELAIYKIKN